MQIQQHNKAQNKIYMVSIHNGFFSINWIKQYASIGSDNSFPAPDAEPPPFGPTPKCNPDAEPERKRLDDDDE